MEVPNINNLGKLLSLTSNSQHLKTMGFWHSSGTGHWGETLLSKLP